MLAKRIIPCLDVHEGRVVKGTRFINMKDAGDPVKLASYYDCEGADEIVFLDITASIEGRKAILDVVRRTAEAVFIPLTVGGGIDSVELMQELLHCGADKISLNTAALQDPLLIRLGADRFGSQCIIAAIDARRKNITAEGNPAWEVYSHGGRRATGRDAEEWAFEAEKLGAGEILLTSMDADGTREGYDIDLLKAVTGAVDIPVIASGGAGKMEHMLEALTAGGAHAVLAASILHYGTCRISEIKQYLAENGLPVRPVTGNEDYDL
ncbi:MAG: imidazole glycerol phosphate synthase subunit HisF [Bacillota bacterium]